MHAAKKTYRAVKTFILCSSIASTVALLASLAFQLLSSGTNNTTANYQHKPSLKLGVCILSARSHQEQRSAIRNTWMTIANMDTNNEGNTSFTAIAKFVVGLEGCPIHPRNRITEYGCEEWMANVTIDLSADYAAFVDDHYYDENGGEKRTVSASRDARTYTGPTNTRRETVNTNSSRTGPIAEKISVTVLHPVVVKRLGIVASVELTHVPHVASLTKDTDEEEIRAAQFSTTDPGVVYNGYRYQPIIPISFPKGTQLELSLSQGVTTAPLAVNRAVRLEPANDAVLSSLPLSKHLHSVLPTNHAVHDSIVVEHNVYEGQGPGVVLVQGLREDGTAIHLGSHLFLYSHISFMYTVKNPELLILHHAQKAHVQDEWKRHIEKEQQELQQEADTFGDILLVDSTDVYRSLPSKLLQCHEWFDDNFAADAILKTDDDVYVALDRVLEILTLQNGVDQWWGNFRHDWAVQRSGKWREEDYSLPMYPPFACGSGYVVSQKLHRWLAANKPFLHSFQGEDISMAIWLMPLHPTITPDTRWQCFKTCQDAMLSMPDLTPHEMHTLWDRRLQSSLCS